MAYKRSVRMQEKLTESRQRIVLAARQLVAEGGYRNAPMAAVAAAAGVSTGLIYRHFRCRSELFVEVLDAAVGHELSLLRTIAAEPLPAAQRLRQAIAAFVRRALAGPGLAYAFIAEPSDPEVEAARLRGRRQLGELFRDLLAEGVASGELPEQDLDVAAACIIGAFTEALVGPLAPSRASTGDAQRLSAAICTFCLRAVGAGN
jgi:AcrR family transcriptional regulator